MSRRKPVDNSAAVSLFPFLAVLLCTMGALLVVLVAVSRAAREAALRKASDAQQNAAVAENPALQTALEKIGQYNARLNEVRSQAGQQLREDQLRLAQLEGHMRKLQNQLDRCQAAALELDAMEAEHYDDREQAEREIERLETLIAEARESVDDLKSNLRSEKRTFAIVPYEGPNGTFRRPIYIECKKDEILLQPEGVRLLHGDLYPLFGAGNPLASAIRAARDYHIQMHPEEGADRDKEPYPLLLVRPEGRSMFYLAQRAIRSSDFEFGFELVEEDWELKYPVADPKLATIEQQAIDQARIRQQALAAAAPRAYRQAALALSGRFEVGEDSSDVYSFASAGGEGEPGFGGGSRAEVDIAQAAANDSTRANGGNGGPFNEHDPDAESMPPDGARTFSADGANDASTAPGSPSALVGTGASGAAAPGGQMPGEMAGSTSASAGAGASAGLAGTSEAASLDPAMGNHMVVSSGRPPRDKTEELHQPPAVAPRERDWALHRKKPTAVAIRRSLQIIVRNDFVAILPDDAPLDATSPSGKRVAIAGDTVESLDAFAAAIREHVEGWGFAGEGMYWRPVLIVHVGPDGRRRAEDLARLLKNSGLELRPANVNKESMKEPRRATTPR
jgi:hypothetical protein